MRESLATELAPSIQIRCNRMSAGAIHCTEDAKRVGAAKGIWPEKTAENWADAAGVQVRMVRYWIAGTHPVSDAGRLALIREVA